MPQYIMQVDDWNGWNRLSAFTRGYIEAALFCGVELPYGHPDGDHRRNDDAAFDDIDARTLQEMRRDCVRFQRNPIVRPLLKQAYERGYTVVQAGHDFWFTRNGHGAGFWDRKELDKDGLGDALSEQCKKFGEYSLFTADDETVYGERC